MNLILNRLRRYCKWHQKQVKVAGEWKYQPRLVSWYGPCEYEVSMKVKIYFQMFLN